jgi:hypothetical protein
MEILRTKAASRLLGAGSNFNHFSCNRLIKDAVGIPTASKVVL